MSFFQGNEWLILLLIAILLIWGPTKLPQLARGLGRAFYEFRRATQGIIEEEETERPPRISRTGIEKIDDTTLIKLAEKLGVQAEGKTREQLIEAIIKEAKKKGLLEEA
ncbi:MAG: twin-arginine translocase TatA/TatE family subunit [Pyrodictiaceae archaeon]